MATVRKKKGANTRVIAFRVTKDLFDELKKLKAESGLSFTDLIKLGAGIDTDKIDAKISRATGLDEKIENRERELQAIEQKLEDLTTRGMQEVTEKLEKAYQVFLRFKLGWRKEEVKLLFGVSDAEVSQYFNQWCTMTGQSEKIQEERLKKCLKRHIVFLQEQILWRACGQELEGAKRQLAYYRRLLINPSQMTEEEKELLFAKYPD